MLALSVITSILTAIATSATAIIAYVAFRSTKRVRVLIEPVEDSKGDIMTSDGIRLGISSHYHGEQLPTFRSLRPEVQEFDGQPLTAELIKKLEKAVNK